MKTNNKRKTILKIAQQVGLGVDGEQYLKKNLTTATEKNIDSAHKWITNLSNDITSHDIGVLNGILER